ncbi:MAG: acyloxyacyl hydrolase [Variibacter sp.]
MGWSGVLRAQEPLAVFDAPPHFTFAERWEARAGFFFHDRLSPGPESNTYDLHGALVTPRLWTGEGGPWDVLLPRLQVGGFLNLSGRTSAAFVDALWTIPLKGPFFAEIFVGPSIHDGSLRSTATMAGLGCRMLVHAGASVGMRLSEHVSVLATYAHMSNAKSLSDCPQNQGLDNIGLQIAHSF